MGIEIGPLSKPIVTREMGNIRYVDHANTENLRKKYATDPNVEVSQIVDVDYVWGERTLPELVANAAPFDYVIASHVIEHVPDLIGWLKEIHAVLKPGGVLSLAIPDKRYCFDYHRSPTQAAEVVDAYLRGQRQPEPRQVFDFLSSVACWQGHFTWSESADFKAGDVVRTHSAAEAWEMTKQVFASGEYHDVHCWVFTPDSFFSLLKTLISANLFDFKVATFSQTEGCEFFVTLEAMDSTKDETERQQTQLASLPSDALLNPAKTINSIDEILLLTTALEQERHHSQVIQKRLEELQKRCQHARSKLKTLRLSKQQLRKKVQTLQADLDLHKNELAAMRSSKFWKLREQWMRLKKGLNSEHQEASNSLSRFAQTSVSKPLKDADQKIRQRLNFQAQKIKTLQEQLLQQEEQLRQLSHQINDQSVLMQKLEFRSTQYSPILWKSAVSGLQQPLPSVKKLLEQESTNEAGKISILRRIIEQLGETVQAVQMRQISDQELLEFVQKDDYPIPPSQEREGYWGNEHISYWVLGLADYCFLKHFMKEMGKPILPQFSFLDLGCASGRVLRHFAIQDAHLNLYGADIYRINIEWIRKYLPQTITAFQNTVLPILPLQSNSLDLIYAGSVFTHIDDLEETWLLEIQRVLKVGGMAFITIHSDRTWQQIRQHHSTHFLYQHFSTSPHFVKEFNTTEITPSLFEQQMPPRVVFDATSHVINQTNVFHSIDYIQQEWGRFFKVEQIFSKAHGDHQDGVVLIKQ
jgi:2-polyprenyl-3-methyl-5-hydroxy-6-metoxy-1,4-benzoquinol methylase